MYGTQEEREQRVRMANGVQSSWRDGMLRVWTEHGVDLEERSFVRIKGRSQTEMG